MSAVIYAAIVVMWAVVLVPMWLRRHDAATESRSVDRFSTAMRTLSRRTTSAPGRRYVVMPRRSEGVTVHVSGAAAPKHPPRRTEQARPARPAGPARPARRKASLVARRRRLLLGLLALTFVTFVAAAAGALPWPVQIVVDLLLVAFCAHLRSQARRVAATSRSRTATAAVAPAAAARATAGPATRPAHPAAGAAPAVVEDDVATAVFHPNDADEAMRFPVEPAMPTVAPAATGTDGGTDGGIDSAADTWQPVPVPRPTYTMKPPAPAFQADPTYTDPVYSPPAVSAEVDADDTDLDEILDRRWAVND
ncbi:MAG TPA: hypothetical protein VFT62_06210 [Mycobacteriales bacterium]|nr:hypothetical protein [Mycobacteriales bacterium]